MTQQNQNPNRDQQQQNNPKPGQPGQQQGGGQQKPGQQSGQGGQQGQQGGQQASRAARRIRTAKSIRQLNDNAKPRPFGGAFAYPRVVHQRAGRRPRRVSSSPAARLCLRHGHGDGTAAVSSLRRSAGRPGVRLHPCRNHRVALLGARLD